MTILFTGFDPFGGETINPAWEAVKALPDMIGSTHIVKKEIPTVFGKAGETVIDTMKSEHPDAVICVGQAGGSTGIRVERIAVNLRDARGTDNAGYSPTDEPVMPGETGAYFATIPVKAIRDALNEAGISANLSNSAGLFVCNDTMYALLHHIACNAPAVLGGFIHVPFIPEQTEKKSPGTPSMPLAQITQALEIAAETTIAFLKSEK